MNCRIAFDYVDIQWIPNRRFQSIFFYFSVLYKSPHNLEGRVWSSGGESWPVQRPGYTMRQRELDVAILKSRKRQMNLLSIVDSSYLLFSETRASRIQPGRLVITDSRHFRERERFSIHFQWTGPENSQAVFRLHEYYCDFAFRLLIASWALTFLKQHTQYGIEYGWTDGHPTHFIRSSRRDDLKNNLFQYEFTFKTIAIRWERRHIDYHQYLHNWQSHIAWTTAMY